VSANKLNLTVLQ